jgi:competence protein ComEA
MQMKHLATARFLEFMAATKEVLVMNSNSIVRGLAALSLAAIVAAPALAKDATKPAPAAAMKHTAPAAPKKALVDINTATEADLAALPAIGDAYAAKIVAGRPYKEKSDLLHKKVVPASVYSKIKNEIVAKHS